LKERTKDRDERMSPLAIRGQLEVNGQGLLLT
jgi:hypothetical protein